MGGKEIGCALATRTDEQRNARAALDDREHLKLYRQLGGETVRALDGLSFMKWFPERLFRQHLPQGAHPLSLPDCSMDRDIQRYCHECIYPQIHDFGMNIYDFSCMTLYFYGYSTLGLMWTAQK